VNKKNNICLVVWRERANHLHAAVHSTEVSGLLFEAHFLPGFRPVPTPPDVEGLRQHHRGQELRLPETGLRQHGPGTG